MPHSATATWGGRPAGPANRSIAARFSNKKRAAALDALLRDDQSLIALPRHLEFGLVARLFHHLRNLADVRQRRVERPLIDAGAQRFLPDALQKGGREASITLGEPRPSHA
jgi:hypothetical protein